MWPRGRNLVSEDDVMGKQLYYVSEDARVLSDKDRDEILFTTLQKAKLGDMYEARLFHQLLAWSVIGHQNWRLTDYSKSLLASIHESLANCRGNKEQVAEKLMEITLLRPLRGNKRTEDDESRDFHIACRVDQIMLRHELVEGLEPLSISSACEKISESGEFSRPNSQTGREQPLSPKRIENIYYKSRAKKPHK